MVLSMHTKAQQRQPQTGDCSVASNWLPRARYRQGLTPPTAESLLRGYRADTPRGQLQITSGQDPISFTSGPKGEIPKGRSQQAPDTAEARLRPILLRMVSTLTTAHALCLG